ncbi:MAG: hypothetical protein AAFQ59_10245 [Pseudomonadota bacterium]
MKKIIAASALVIAGLGATTASAQGELVAGTILSTQVVAGVIVATVLVAVSDDGTVTTTTVALSE